MIEEPAPDEGPVLVTVKYVIDPAKAGRVPGANVQNTSEFAGATRSPILDAAGIFFDTEAQDVYLESFVVDSWAEHARQHDRFTQADLVIEKRVLSYAVKPIVVKHYIHAPRQRDS